MRNNILGGLVIFFVVVTCLLMLDDITSPKNEQTTYDIVEVESPNEDQNDLAIIDNEE